MRHIQSFFYLLLPIAAFCASSDDVFIPLEKGNRWIYEQRFFDFKGKLESTDTLELEIIGLHEVRGRTLFEYRWQEAEEADLIYQGEDGIYLGGRIRDGNIEFYDQPVLFMKFSLEEGDFFVDKVSNIRYEFIGKNLRTTPAGKYETMRFLVYDIDGNTPTFQEYAPGVGLVYVEITGQWMEIRLLSFELK